MTSYIYYLTLYLINNNYLMFLKILLLILMFQHILLYTSQLDNYLLTYTFY
jgi:hypothetical protein